VQSIERSVSSLDWPELGPDCHRISVLQVDNVRLDAAVRCVIQVMILSCLEQCCHRKTGTPPGVF
jgi:hypothetical protein